MSSPEPAESPPAVIKFGPPSRTALQACPSHFNWLPSTELDPVALKLHHGKLIEFIQDITDVEVTPLTIISQRFMLYLFESLLGIGESDHKQVENVIEGLKAEFSREEYATFKYLLLVERAVLEGLKNGAEQQQVIMDMMEGMFKEQSVELQSNEAMATLWGLKGLLMGLLGQSGDRVKCFQEATKLCLTSSPFHQYLFSSLRRVRRIQDWRSYPTAEEADACMKGYELLQYKTSSCLLRMATLYDDLLKAKNRLPLPDYIEERLKCPAKRAELKKRMMTYVKTAVSLNPHSISLQCKYGDFLKGDPKQELEYWDKLVQKYPENSEVLHKVGRFHGSEAGGWNIEYALKLFSRGLEANSANFPCLMDYLRSLGKTRGSHDDWSKVLAAVDKYSPAFSKMDTFKRRLDTVKGTVLYFMGKDEEAVQYWAKGWDPKGAQAVDVMEIERTLSCSSLFGQSRHIDLAEIKELLKRLEDGGQLYAEIEEALRGTCLAQHAEDLNNNSGGGGRGGGGGAWRRESQPQSQSAGRGGGGERRGGGHRGGFLSGSSRGCDVGGLWKQEPREHHGGDKDNSSTQGHVGWRADWQKRPFFDADSGVNRNAQYAHDGQHQQQPHQCPENDNRPRRRPRPQSVDGNEFLRRTLAGMGLGGGRREGGDGGRGSSGGEQNCSGRDRGGSGNGGHYYSSQHYQPENNGGSGDASYQHQPRQHQLWFYQSEGRSGRGDGGGARGFGFGSDNRYKQWE